MTRRKLPAFSISVLICVICGKKISDHRFHGWAQMGFGGMCRFCLILGLMRWLGLGEDRISEFLEFQYVGPQMSRMGTDGV
jgi:hypothetical protein